MQDSQTHATGLHRAFVSGFAVWLLCMVQAVSQQSPDPLVEARSLVAAGELHRADTQLRAVLSAHPSSADAHFLLGYVLFREQRPKDSLAEFTAGAAHARPRADDLKIVASDYVMLGDYGDADKWLTQVVVAAPDDADAWYLLGRTKFNEDNFAAAASCFQRALALRPNDIRAENNLGLAWLETSQTGKAKSAFQAAIDWQGPHPLDAQPFLNLGTLLADEGSADKAIPYLQKASSLAPDNPKVHEELAKAYTRRSDWPMAQRELEFAVKLAPKISALHFKLAQVYRKEGLQERAEKEFAICAQLNSTHSSAETPNPPR
ncbi:MAG TPA: tetratricopeptide repeat protein [Terracidiphilus sp.]|nr:tetratricopeptide repeat protein [Terracidiphilus sp.]